MIGSVNFSFPKICCAKNYVKKIYPKKFVQKNDGPQKCGSQGNFGQKEYAKKLSKENFVQKNLGINNFCQQYVGQTKILVPKIFFVKKKSVKKRGGVLKGARRKNSFHFFVCSPNYFIF